MQTLPTAMGTQLELNGQLLASRIQQLEKSMDGDNISPGNRSLKDTFNQQLTQVRHAQQRLMDGQYGLCEFCGYPIPKERLEAYPEATTCIPCKQQALKGHLRRMRLGVTSTKEQTTYVA